MLEHPWHPQEKHLQPGALVKRRHNWKIQFRKSLTYVEPLEVVPVFQVNSSLTINRVNAIEDDGGSGTTPDKGNEEDCVQKVVSHINA